MWTPGPLELVIILVVVLVIFGPKRLPELGKSMGRGLREFKNSISGDKDNDSSEEKRPELQASEEQPTQPATGAATEKPAEPVEGEIVSEKKA